MCPLNSCDALTASHDIHLDRRNKIVTTAAFMCDTALYEIYEGIGAMIEKIIMLVGDGHK